MMTFGVNLHCAPERSPVGQESVTRLGKDEPAGAGKSLADKHQLFDLLLTVWLGVAELAEKSCITVSGTVIRHCVLARGQHLRHESEHPARSAWVLALEPDYEDECRGKRGPYRQTPAPDCSPWGSIESGANESQRQTFRLEMDHLGNERGTHRSGRTRAIPQKPQSGSKVQSVTDSLRPRPVQSLVTIIIDDVGIYSRNRWHAKAWLGTASLLP